MFASKFKRLSITCASIVVAAGLCVGLTAAPAIAELTAGEIAGEETTASATVVLSQDSFDYDGEAHVPDVVSVTLPDGTVLEPTDYTASYEKVAALDWLPDAVAEPETIISAGTYRVIVMPTEDAQWEGTGTAMFEIAGLGEVRNAIPTLWEGDNATYTGSPVELPAECVGKLFLPPTSGGPDSWLLEEGKDYELVYKDNVDAGVAGVYAIGNGAYTGWTKLTEFEIAPAPVSSASASKIAGATYTGKQVKRSVSLSFNGIPLEEGKDYELAYKDNVKAGKATVTVKGKGNFAGERDLTFTIAKASVANAKLGSVKTATYTGKQVKARPKVTYGGMTLKLGRDYTLSYKNNVKAGKATVTVKGKGNFKGAKAAKFVIAYNIAHASRAPMKAYVYTGSAIKAKPSLTFNGRKLKLGRDYTLSYKNNVKAGKATVTVKGSTKGFFAGSKKLTFRIAKASASSMSVSKIAKQKFTSLHVKPKPTVKYRGRTLVFGKDYTLSYKNNVWSGKATVTVKGKGNFKGAKSTQFIIKQMKYKRRDGVSFNNNECFVLDDEPRTLYYLKPGEQWNDYLVKYQNGTTGCLCRSLPKHKIVLSTEIWKQLVQHMVDKWNANLSDPAYAATASADGMTYYRCDTKNEPHDASWEIWYELLETYVYCRSEEDAVRVGNYGPDGRFGWPVSFSESFSRCIFEVVENSSHRGNYSTSWDWWYLT